MIQVGLQTIEVKTQLTHRDYTNLLSQENPNHFPVFKTRRCFMYKNQYFQLDIYKEPSHRRCKVRERERLVLCDARPPPHFADLYTLNLVGNRRLSTSGYFDSKAKCFSLESV